MLSETLRPDDAGPIPYGRQDVTDADLAAVAETLRADYLTQGPKVTEFEEAFAEYCGAKHAVAVANGTAALHLCALALGVARGTRVITSPITFAASGNCVRYCDGEVWFADIDPETLVLSLGSTRELIESHPPGFFAGIIPVDFAGYPVNMEAFRALADEHGLWIIEDACHAPGASRTASDGTSYNTGSGRFSDLAIFSFHPVKHIACGEGGMITTSDDGIAQHLRRLRTHGITKDDSELRKSGVGGWYMEMQELGFNYRMPDILCALGISQLARAENGLTRRREIARRYDAAFAKTDGVRTFKTFGSGFGHAFHLYVIHVDDRRGLYDHLRENRVYAQVHYVPLHTMPYYADIGYDEADLREAEVYYAGGLSLPMYPTLSQGQQERVIRLVQDFTA